MDYMFYGVNTDTCRLAPEEAMRFGRAFQWLLEDIVNADPRFGPVYLCKVDISDGFYQSLASLSQWSKMGSTWWHSPLYYPWVGSVPHHIKSNSQISY
jgi:hypothetical protein